MQGGLTLWRLREITTRTVDNRHSSGSTNTNLPYHSTVGPPDAGMGAAGRHLRMAPGGQHKAALLRLRGLAGCVCTVEASATGRSHGETITEFSKWRGES